MTLALARHKPQAPENQEFTLIQEQLNKIHFPVLEAVCQASGLIPDLANLVTQYELNRSATNWYEAITRLQIPITYVPTLPENLREILESDCPILGAPHKVKETHTLSLIHKDYGTIDDLEKKFLDPFGQKTDEKGKHSLKLRFTRAEAQQYITSPFKETYFQLATIDVIPESRLKTWAEQVELLKKRIKETGVNYQILTLQEGFVEATTHKVATGRSLFPAKNLDTKNQANWTRDTWTRVPEMVGANHLALGGYDSSGISLNNSGNDQILNVYGDIQSKKTRVGIAIGVRL